MCIYIYVYLYTYLKQQTVNIRIKTTHQHSVSLCSSFLLTRCYRRDRDVPPSGKRWCSRSPYRSRRGQLGSWCVTLWLFNITMGKSPCLMGKFTISMVIFHSYVSHYQRVAALSSMPKIWNLARSDDHRNPAVKKYWLIGDLIGVPKQYGWSFFCTVFRYWDIHFSYDWIWFNPITLVV